MTAIVNMLDEQTAARLAALAGTAQVQVSKQTLRRRKQRKAAKAARRGQDNEEIK